MNILEERSNTRIVALKRLVKKGQYPVEYAIGKLDDLNKSGFLTSNDYDETFEYLNSLMKEDIAKEEEVSEIQETEEIVEDTADASEEFENVIEVIEDELEKTSEEV